MIGWVLRERECVLRGCVDRVWVCVLSEWVRWYHRVV